MKESSKAEIEIKVNPEDQNQDNIKIDNTTNKGSITSNNNEVLANKM